MSMVGFPLLLIPLAIYNIIVFLMPGVSFADPLVTVTLMSGAGWPVTLSDMLLALGILLLLFEIIKGARPGREISHRPSAFVDGVRRGGRRISAVAASSATRPIACWRCWRWWISCRASPCAHGAARRLRQAPRLAARRRQSRRRGPATRAGA